MQMAILVRLYFSDTTDTPLKMVQTLQIGGYSDKEEVLSALATVFPGSSADDRMAAIQETYGN
ncbi:hypothetical protein [Bacillus sp. ISL-7]|uniref:hypothetical protein n=1 Tax=Bacillus sp. ISL-7 TaxID=2819136 RepID=UPI001BE557F0|nr:hypothetical protein [Bacillus sp. ISL-7]